MAQQPSFKDLSARLEKLGKDASDTKHDMSNTKHDIKYQSSIGEPAR